ncbi:MAG: hypothetical protein WBM08_09815 [Prochlorococcaceae cyanobacterium]
MRYSALISVPIIASLLQASALISPVQISIDTQGPTILPPLIKSKLGVARAAGNPSLPATIPYLKQLGSRAFCSTIAFDQLTDRPRPNYALGSSTFTATTVRPDPRARRWLQSLLQSLSQYQQQIYLGLVGAPTPYQQPIIRKPAAHPTPTNMTASAQLTARWVRDIMPAGLPINWVIWNEPEHTLRGTNSTGAADDMSRIYRAYQGALVGRSPADGFGLASFMKASLRNSSNDPTKSFVDLVMGDLMQAPSPRIDYITLNNYHGQTFELIAKLQSDLRRAGMDQPLVLNQFAPAILGSHPSVAGSVQVASQYLHNLDRFVQAPEIASTCMSFWTGADRKALLRETQGIFTPSLPYQALASYQHMPLWRLPIKDVPADLPFTLWAARYGRRFSLMIVPIPVATSGGLSGGGATKAERKRERKSLRQQERQTERRNQGGDLPPQAPGSTASVILQLELAGLPNQLIKVQRLVVGRTSPLGEQLRTDVLGRLTLPVAADQIVMLSSGTDSAAESAPLLVPSRSDLYIHRQAPEQGWASLDALTDGFVLALPSPQAVAHASATYPPQVPGASLLIQLTSPQSAAGVARALKCTAALLQGLEAQRPLTLAAWGNPAAIATIVNSRAVSAEAGAGPTISSWPGLDARGRLRLPLPKRGKLSALKLHLAAVGCDSGTQLQAQVLR